MVRNSNPVYLDLATGAVHGSPAPAAGADEATSGNLIPNTLLEGVPLTTKAPATSSADDAPAGSDPGATSIGAPPPAGAAAVPTETGAADGGSADESVASGANELAAPQTR